MSDQMTPEEITAANRKAPIPPAFGEGQPWSVYRLAFKTTHEGNVETLIPNGFRVQKHLHAFYWAEHASYSAMVAEAARVGCELNSFALVDRSSNAVRGAGQFEPGDGATEMALLSCIFIEMLDCRLALVTPREFDHSKIAGAQSMSVAE